MSHWKDLKSHLQELSQQSLGEVSLLILNSLQASLISRDKIKVLPCGKSSLLGAIKSSKASAPILIQSLLAPLFPVAPPFRKPLWKRPKEASTCKYRLASTDKLQQIMLRALKKKKDSNVNTLAPEHAVQATGKLQLSTCEFSLGVGSCQEVKKKNLNLDFISTPTPKPRASRRIWGSTWLLSRCTSHQETLRVYSSQERMCSSPFVTKVLV